jgi:halocyanin-like protein
MDNQPLSRRRALRLATSGVVGAAATATPTAAQPAFDGWLSDVGNYDGVADMTGQEEVRVDVGAEGNGGSFAYDPAAIQVDPGTTVVWEWTGEGQQHNVVTEDGPDLESELTGEAGFTFEHTFDTETVLKYYCTPHRALGMKGVVVVGDLPGGEETGDEANGGGPPSVPDVAKTLGVAATVAMGATLGLAYLFLRYGGPNPPSTE